ncbi:Tex family protein [Massiliimalia massiliensis]|uniref:Tex family protein n=1 Tax=Massiliimalia massiliensis TaxID=1852384 RepID=UPI0009864EDF|nr:Tex family protein [Massiliimalia massiliensis]
MDIIKKLQEELKLQHQQVENTVKLIDEGNTIPFIARYRKELTGSLDDQVLRALSERLTYLRGLEKRKEEVLALIEGQEKLTDGLRQSIEQAQTMTEVEDLYRPFRPKRKTRASVAKEKGLAPLAELILKQRKETGVAEEAKAFLNDEVETIEAAVAGALDIIAEEVSDDASLRGKLRAQLLRQGRLVTKASDPEAESVYTMYYEYQEPLSKIAGHRVLAADRGEREGFLKVSVETDEAAALNTVCRQFVKGEGEASELVQSACEDSYSRLIFPSLEREIRSQLTEQADEQAIHIFAENLEKLLMQPPVKDCVTLGLDPAYRTGCKIAVVDGTGKVLATTVVYPTPPQKKAEEAKRTLSALIKKYHVTVISIGNGTASRESESFVAELIRELETPVSYMVVSEAGASVYSASKLAAEEFPEYDVSLRSAVSIARRLQDPLAELVKIDPKAIGVGQYQHDMPKARMDEALGGVVEHCVNTVGVDLNTASQPLLARVAGINQSVARNIVAYREENGAFQNRKELMKVPKLGAKAFTQCAGFLRIPGGQNILDYTGVHPESYPAAEQLLQACGYQLSDVADRQIGELAKRAEGIGYPELAKRLDTGIPTLRDIVAELQKPGRDPRDELPKPLLRSDVLELKDLKPGMELKGTVRNVIDFGAFVDIGVHEDGLVHISQLSNRFVKHPLDVVSVGDIVTVWVLDVDLKRKRIALTMKQPGK